MIAFLERMDRAIVTIWFALSTFLLCSTYPPAYLYIKFATDNPIFSIILISCDFTLTAVFFCVEK